MFGIIKYCLFLLFSSVFVQAFCQNLKIDYDVNIKKEVIIKGEKNSGLYLMYIQSIKDIKNYPMEFIISGKDGYSIDFSKSLDVNREIQRIPVPKVVTLSFVGLSTITYSNNGITYSTNDNNTIESYSINSLGQWQVTNQVKEILGYTCYKAFFTSNVPELNRASMIIPTYAWFTNEIPVIGGPTIFGSLPGLILELETKGGYFIATEIKQTTKKVNKIDINDKNVMDFIQAEKYYEKIIRDKIGN